MTWNSVLNNLLIGSDGAVCQLSSMPQIESYVSSSARGEADAARLRCEVRSILRV